jgi:hypothetical protein
MPHLDADAVPLLLLAGKKLHSSIEVPDRVLCIMDHQIVKLAKQHFIVFVGVKDSCVTSTIKTAAVSEVNQA